MHPKINNHIQTQFHDLNADSSLSEKKHIYTVSELNSEIKFLLEEAFPFIWISGEISNFRMPASGHFYFTLKDEASQINALMFSGQNRNLTFELEDGLHVVGLGRITLYEPRGTYQIILEYIEPKGTGALQLAFEQLKKKLMAEGLFDVMYKKPLPVLPRKIHIITSPTGAVAYDMIHVLHRRFANIPIEIIPVKVQGEGAAEAIVAALEFSNQRKDASVVVIARGGGSLEDLQAFNSESVVRAIFSSEIPVVSAIGHETDFTISDFVADLRAPTPSAAAELIVPVKAELEQKNKNLLLTLSHQLQRHLNYHRTKACSFSERLVDPKKRIVDLRIKIDDITSRLMRAFIFGFQRQFEQFCFRKKHLKSHNPLNRIHLAKVTIDKINFNLLKLIKIFIDKYNWKIQNLTSRLNDLNPIEILKRGYSITQTIPEKEMVLDANQVNIGDHVKIVLSKGNLICRVERK
jgi:exodeoxyribonuclease VII large subunit